MQQGTFRKHAVWLAVAALGLTMTAELVAQEARVETILFPGSAIDDGLALAPNGHVYGSYWGVFGGAAGRHVYEVSPIGEKRVVAEGLQNPNGLAVDTSGTLYIAHGGGTIEAVTSVGVQRTFANGRVSGLAVDPSGTWLYYTVWASGVVGRYALSGGPAQVVKTGFAQPVGFTFGASGEWYVGSFENGQIHRVDAQGEQSLLADLPSGIGFLTWSRGHVIATGHDHRIYEITPTGEVSVLAGTGVAGFQDGSVSDAQLRSPNGIVPSVTGDTLFFTEFRSKALRMLIRPPVSTSQEIEQPVPSFRLDPSYPNPFKEETTLTYVLEQPQEVRVAVYDALGKAVAVLQDGWQATGKHKVHWQADPGTRAGLYTLRVMAPTGEQSRTVIHVK